MKAQDIRNIRGPQDIAEGVFYLKEMTAQLADLNERLDGFMASMLALCKAINELNTEITKPEPPLWWTEQGKRKS